MSRAPERAAGACYALVTGGSRGIGAAVVAALAQAGAEGAVFDLRAPAPDTLPSGWEAVEVDLADDEALAAAFAQLPRRLDVLVAAAGVVPAWGGLGELDLAEWDRVFAINVRAVAATLHHASGLLSDGAGVVVIASLNAWRGDANLPSYTASKHAVLGLVRSAALELGRRGVRVNAVAPGPIATEALLERMARRARGGGSPVEQALVAAAGQTALGRIATPAEVAAAVAFLAGAQASGITGQLLAIDGGLL
jgi:NAD(P)-dependent dehydrogenase (short-subunit alcohol dehydrogenase family)